MKFITEAKKFAHGIVVAVGIGLGWAFSPQGQSVIGGVIKAYPKLSFITTLLGVAGVVYFNPKPKPVVQ